MQVSRWLLNIYQSLGKKNTKVNKGAIDGGKLHTQPRHTGKAYQVEVRRTGTCSKKPLKRLVALNEPTPCL